MNYYEILKISKNATDEEIKNSYKKLVKIYHPDLYVGDKNFAEQKIKEINEAYEILSDPKRKAEYDEYLNPPIKPAVESNAYTSNYNTATSQSNHQPDTTSDSITWSISDFILKQINKLDKTHQLQIFILIVVLILALFLINLIQMKRYLSIQNVKQQIVTDENSENENFSDYDNFIDENTNYETNSIPNNEVPYSSMEELLNAIFSEYYEDSSNKIYNITEEDLQDLFNNNNN